MSRSPVRVLIADDQALVRAGFRLILESQADLQVVAEAADGGTAVRLTRRHRPDVVLMDVRMPGMDGIEATRQILGSTEEAAARPRVIILTTFDLDEYVYAALQSGACGFLLKDVTPERLIDSVRTVVDGDALLAPSITRRLVERFARPQQGQPSGSPDAIASLTPRELEVFGLIARGLSNAEIGESLVVSEATVKTHVASVLAKLGVRNRAQAVILAYESGLVQASGTA